VDSSTLVEILLWEKDAAAAWAEAHAWGCGPELWLPLAKLRERTHPEEAVPVYQRLIEAHAGRKNNRDYEEAAGLVKRVGGLLGALGRVEDYRAYLRQLRLRHKPKRNFMKLLEKLESP